jgi:hypothetical protein
LLGRGFFSRNLKVSIPSNSYSKFSLRLLKPFTVLLPLKALVSSHVEILDSLIVFIYYRKTTQRSGLFVLYYAVVYVFS